jgi:hypothetical protein
MDPPESRPTSWFLVVLEALALSAGMTGGGLAGPAGGQETCPSSPEERGVVTLRKTTIA